MRLSTTEELLMTQNELNRAVAAATGETISEIRSHGFSLLAPLPKDREPVVAHRGRRRRSQRRGRKRNRHFICSETE